jgi:hypothetical protein
MVVVVMMVMVVAFAAFYLVAFGAFWLHFKSRMTDPFVGQFFFYSLPNLVDPGDVIDYDVSREGVLGGADRPDMYVMDAANAFAGAYGVVYLVRVYVLGYCVYAQAEALGE